MTKSRIWRVCFVSMPARQLGLSGHVISNRSVDGALITVDSWKVAWTDMIEAVVVWNWLAGSMITRGGYITGEHRASSDDAGCRRPL